MTNTNRGEAWPLQDAKARFSELVKACADYGAQTVTKHGKPAAVVLSWDAYQVLKKRSCGLKEFFESAPRAELDLEREADGERELGL